MPENSERQPALEERLRAREAELEALREELDRTTHGVVALSREMELLRRELDDTNRGVIALYAELDERAAELQRVSQSRERFVRATGHELRTPISAIIALSRLLLDRVDGDLTPEQAKQVSLLHDSAQQLSAFIDDLLDLARVDAGRVPVEVSRFAAADLFSALRGIFRPLLTNPEVKLSFEEPAGPIEMSSDERKVGQILRNLVSNALKFTERGEVRVRAERRGEEVAFAVADTGIGIAPKDLEVIFEEFGQLRSPVQRRVKGTGLGLPLSRRLAELLGGRIEVTSAVGVGSTFTLLLPVICPPMGHRERQP